MPKRPDYGDATPEDLALALIRFQRAPLKKPPESGADEENPTSPMRKKRTPTVSDCGTHHVYCNFRSSGGATRAVSIARRRAS